jgi:hypothetical protein
MYQIIQRWISQRAQICHLRQQNMMLRLEITSLQQQIATYCEYLHTMQRYDQQLKETITALQKNIDQLHDIKK